MRYLGTKVENLQPKTREVRTTRFHLIEGNEKVLISYLNLSYLMQSVASETDYVMLRCSSEALQDKL